MKYLVLIVLVTVINLISAANKNPGHLKPFGSVGSLINIEEMHGEFPTVSKLFTSNIPESETVISRQVLNGDKHYEIWQTDDQLENEVYGLSKVNIHVESYKSRQRQRVEMTFGEFLERYKKEPLLFADLVPEILR
jgi:hypothetical protein